MTSDLEDDELGLFYFALLGHDVVTEASLHPGVHRLLSILEMIRVLQITWRTSHQRQNFEDDSPELVINRERETARSPMTSSRVALALKFMAYRSDTMTL